MTFQEIILALERYWSDYGCVLVQPYDVEKGAGTFNPATFLSAPVSYTHLRAHET